MKTQEKSIKITKACGCGNVDYDTKEYEENEYGIWYNCPKCQSTHLKPVDQVAKPSRRK